MGITRASLTGIVTNVATFTDNINVLNSGQSGANNQDIGTLYSRGSSTNVAFIWNETTSSFRTVYTSSNGSATGNLTITSNADIRTGNLYTSGTATITGLLTGTTINAAQIGNSGATLTGTLATASQTSITSVGTLSSLTVTANVTGGNLVTAGQISASGSITSTGVTNGTAFIVGNSAVSNVALGMFPTAGTRGDYAIRDYSTVASTIYFDVGMGGTAAGEFQFRTTNSYSRVMTANTSGVYSPGVVTATGIVSGLELTSTQSSGDEGGQLNLAKAATNTTLAGNVIIDVYQNKLRIFENGGTSRGAYIDLTGATASVGSNLLSGGGTPGGSNTYVQFNDSSTFGGNAQFTYNKTTNTLTAGIVAANNNGNGTNFQVGDDAWIGDINAANTIGVKGQQDGTQGYIVFGNTNATNYIGRSGSNPITVTGAFTVTGTLTGSTINAATIGNSGATLTGTISTAAQTNITSVGTLTSLAVTGNITGGNIIGTLNGSGANVTSISATNISSGTLAQARLANSAVTLGSTALTLGSTVTTVAGLTSVTSTTFVGALTGAATTAGTVTTAAQPNITSVGTLTSLAVTGNITSGNLSGTNIVGTLTTASQTNITGVGTLTTGTWSATTIATNKGGTGLTSFTSGGALYASSTSALTTGTLPVASGGTGVTTAQAAMNAFAGAVTSGYYLRGNGTNVVMAAIQAADIPTLNQNTTGTAATVTTAAQPNITSVGTLTSLTVSGALSSGAHTITGSPATAIVNGGTTGTGNIGASGAAFNTIFAKATSAQYADLAEKYTSDFLYAPGTVVVFGGEEEITVTTQSHDTRVAGVISTNPGFIMNETCNGLPVAFTGRVPCRVQGPVNKGDVLVTSTTAGVAQRIGANYQPGCVIGKALEAINTNNIETIEVVVGRF